MSYEGLRGAGNEQNPHLGGNVVEGDPFTFSPRVWDYMISRFALNSVLDLGCGRGYSSAYFYRKGLHVLAVDGLPENIEHSVFPALQVDLTQSSVNCKVDLVHCQEVVEHIEEKYLDNLIRSLACGKIILMTHAVPGQEGYHHVNLQPTEYWINNLASYNCHVLEEDTTRVRAIASQEGASYLAATGLVLANRNRA